jgi:D-alanyl-D-alanine carboxypeptidase
MMIRLLKYPQRLARFCALVLAVHITLFALPALAAEPPKSVCDSYLLADAASGDILLANKPDERIFPASTTKIMTALLLIENEQDLSRTTTVGGELDGVPSDSSTMGLKKGEVVSLLDLLYGLMLPSGNDAAATIAVTVGGSIADFAQMMNARAASLGMSGTHFVNPHGYHDENHYTTAADLAKLTAEALKSDLFKTVISASSHTFAPTNKHPDGYTLHNTNKLVSKRSANEKYFYSDALGVKTGYTDAAQGCLVAAAERDGQLFIAVMMGDNSTTGSEHRVRRFTDAVLFFEFGFTQRRVDVYPKIKDTALSAVLPGDEQPRALNAIIKTDSVPFWFDADLAQTLMSEETALDVAYEFFDPAATPPPTASNDAVIGTVTYSYQGVVLYQCEVYPVPIAKPPIGDDVSALIRLVSTILIALAGLIIAFILARKLLWSRAQRNRRYQRPRRGRGTRRNGVLRDPHDYTR